MLPNPGSCRLIVFCAMMACAVVFASPGNTTMDKKRVLLLHSYHQGLTWTDSVMQGMLAVLKQSDVKLEIHVEYMDSKRHPPPALFAYLQSLYRRKYHGIRFDVILLSDNNALAFVVKRGADLFPGVPVVFCGINNYTPDLLAGRAGITGVTEEIDINGTLALARQLRPKIRKFVFINDRTPTGRANQEKFKQARSDPVNRAFGFELWDDLTIAELQQRLRGLTPDTAVCLFTFHRDRAGQWFSIAEYLTLIGASSSVPVFSFWHNYIGHGVLGGAMIYGREQGRRCAEYARRILDGAAVASLPVLVASPNPMLLDDRLLRRFGIARRNIPSEALVLFQPESVVRKYQHIIIASVVVVILLAVLVVTLLVNIVKLKHNERERIRLNTFLEAKNAELEQMVYVASHDLRSPLVNIDGYSKELAIATQTLQEALAGAPAEKQPAIVAPVLARDIPEALRFIRTSATKMDTLLSGLLHLSRTGRASLVIESLDMNRLLAKVTDSIEYQIKAAGVALQVGDLPPCRGDAVQINRIFSNLLDNAMKYLDPDRPCTIRVSGRFDGHRSVYCVADNGIGIAPDQREKIFELFQRLDPARGSGEGLGLTIVRRIVSRLQGAVWVESEDGGGSRFYVALPSGR